MPPGEFSQKAEPFLRVLVGNRLLAGPCASLLPARQTRAEAAPPVPHRLVADLNARSCRRSSTFRSDIGNRR